MSNSAAIPIVAPPQDDSPQQEQKSSPEKSTTSSSASSTFTPFTPAAASSSTPTKTRLCRNVVIHGYCKFENKGCEFNHETNKSGHQSPDPAKSRLRVNSPIFTPSTAPASENVAAAAHAPVFVPKLGLGIKKSPLDTTFSAGRVTTNQSQARHPQQQDGIFLEEADYDLNSEMDGMSNSFNQFQVSADMQRQQQQQQQQQQQGLNGNFPFQQRPTYDNFYQPQTVLHQPLMHHLYSIPPPHTANLHPHQKSIHSFFMSDKLREELVERNEAVVRNIPTQDLHLPQQVHVYHSLFPLDDHHDRPNKVFGYSTKVYKVTCSVDGNPYVLRRIEGYRFTNESAMTTIENWRRIRHAGIVSIREAFTTKAFGDHSLIFVYDYHPCSVTVGSKHFPVQMTPGGFAPAAPPGLSILRNRIHSGGQTSSENDVTPSGGVSEKILWSYIAQIASAVKTVHTAGMAVRVIEPTKILLTGKNRIRINCCGIFELINFDAGKNTPHYQQEDLLNFGQLCLSLACSSLSAVHNLPKSLDYMTRYYSPDLKNVVLYLLSKPTPVKSIVDVVAMMGPRLLHEINSGHHYNDYLEGELSRELENGRLVRLLCKLGFINERPEFDMDPSWSETGDRYLLKLFRDYVFHQVDERGRPVLDMAHILQCLNKLDVGVDERVMLVSRDEQSCLIVSYQELKKCAEEAWRDLFRKSV